MQFLPEPTYVNLQDLLHTSLSCGAHYSFKLGEAVDWPNTFEWADPKDIVPDDEYLKKKVKSASCRGNGNKAAESNGAAAASDEVIVDKVVKMEVNDRGVGGRSEVDNIKRDSLARIYRNKAVTRKPNISKYSRSKSETHQLDSDGTFGSGGDSDSSEELRYGPGFVSRLKSRYMSVALRSNTPRPTTLRRTASLEDFLDKDKDEDQIVLNTTFLPVTKSERKQSAVANHIVAAKDKHRRRESIKRAQSVEVLSFAEQNEKSKKSKEPPAAKKVESVLNGKLFSNDDIIIDEKKTVAKAAVVKKQDVGVQQQNNQLQPRRPMFKRRSSGVLFGVQEAELPAPDTVKETRKIFESRAGGSKPAAFRTGGGLTKAKSTSNLYQNRSGQSNRQSPSRLGNRKRSDEDLRRSLVTSTRNLSPVRRNPHLSPRGVSPLSKLRQTSRNKVPAKPTLPSKPAHLSSPSPAQVSASKPAQLSSPKPVTSPSKPAHLYTAKPAQVSSVPPPKSTFTAQPSVPKSTFTAQPSVTKSTFTAQLPVPKSFSDPPPDSPPPPLPDTPPPELPAKASSTFMALPLRPVAAKPTPKTSELKLANGLMSNGVKPSELKTIGLNSKVLTPNGFKTNELKSDGLKANSVQSSEPERKSSRDRSRDRTSEPVRRTRDTGTTDPGLRNTTEPNWRSDRKFEAQGDGTKIVSSKSISNIRRDGDSLSFNFIASSSKPQPPVGDLDHPKQIGVIKPIMRPEQSASPPKSSPPKSSPPRIPNNTSTPEDSSPPLLPRKEVLLIDKEQQPPAKSWMPRQDVKTKKEKNVMEEKVNKDKNVIEAKPELNDKSYRENWKKRKDEQNTLVFNFVNSSRDVPAHIENDGLDLSKRNRKTKDSGVILLETGGESTDGGSASDGELDRPPSPCDVTFIGANVITGKSSLRSKPKPMKKSISFSSSLTEVFEYPSFETAAQHMEQEAKKQQPGAGAAFHAGLGSYTPSKIQMTEAPFQFGVSRGSTTTKTSSKPKPTEEVEEEVLRPNDENAVSWSGNSNSSDILF